MEYSEAFRARMVQRMCGPQGMSATALGREVGVPQPTLSRWLRLAGRVGDGTTAATVKPERPVKKRPDDWSPEERLLVVVEANSVPEGDLGAFLRRKGLHEAQLREWREAALKGLDTKPKASRSRSPHARRVRELERELQRKDKALAETAALLVLQKKVRALWPDEVDATTPKNGR